MKRNIMKIWKVTSIPAIVLGILLVLYGQEIEDYLGVRAAAQDLKSGKAVRLVARKGGVGLTAAASRTGFTAGLVSPSGWSEQDVQTVLQVLHVYGVREVRLNPGEFGLVGPGVLGQALVRDDVLMIELGEHQELSTAPVPEGHAMLWWPSSCQPQEWGQASDMLATARLGESPAFSGGSERVREESGRLLGLCQALK